MTRDVTTAVLYSLLRVRPDLYERAGGHHRRHAVPVPPMYFHAADERVMLLTRPLPLVCSNTTVRIKR